MSADTEPTQAALEALAAELGERLLERGARVATAESCTGGWIAQTLTSVAGSSAWFECGLVTYSNAFKIELLGVDPMTLERHGAVSAETAIEMAAGARRVATAEYAVAVTGIAGPDGGSAAKPVGTVWFGLAAQGQTVRAEKHVFPGDRRAVRARAVETALRALMDLCD